MNKVVFWGALTLCFWLSSVANAQDESGLNVSFADSSWDGVKVPAGQHCKMFDGNGSSPELLVENIPTGANALIVSFSDRSFRPNDNGGHGIIGQWVEAGQSSAIVASVAGETNTMPEGMFIEAKFRSNRGSDGAYLPPCSGGRGNEYYATVSAVKKDQNETQVLAETTIEMGRY